MLCADYPFTFWGPWVRNSSLFYCSFSRHLKRELSSKTPSERTGLGEIFFQMLSIFKGAIAWKTFAHGRRNKRLQSRKLTLEKCFDSTSAGKEANECLDKCSQLTRSAKKVNTGTLRHSVSHISEMSGWQRKWYGPEENFIAQRLLFYSSVMIHVESTSEKLTLFL